MEKSQEAVTPQPGWEPVEAYISKAEVARRLNKRVRTVEDWMKRGVLPYYKIQRSVTFKWSEVDAHLARTCRVAPRN